MTLKYATDSLLISRFMPAPIFQFPLRIYWEDTDAGGIVFYANYLKFFERARTEWLRSLGLGQQQLRLSEGGMFVVSQTSLRYLRPARLDDQLLVSAQLTEHGAASLSLHQQARLHSPQNLPAPHASPNAAPQLLCEGSIRLGWVNADTLRPARIPQPILDLLKT